MNDKTFTNIQREHPNTGSLAQDTFVRNLSPRIETFTLAAHHLTLTAESSLLVTEGLVRKKPIKILIDGGAYPSFVKDSLADDIRSKPLMDRTYNIQLASEKHQAMQGRLHEKLDLQIGHYRVRHDFVSAPIAYDYSRQRLLAEVNPRIDWKTNTISFGDHTRVCTPKHEEKRPFKVEVISANAFKRACRHPDAQIN
ncbi:hypothetical protein HDU67_000185 [Dinochytrium kinnereticum]|nr:hypothetical protein HDU67_000185 [Dinochytrium kinnereticum]